MLDVQIRPRLTTTCASLAIVLAATAGCSEQTSGPDLEAPEVVPVVTGANPTTMPLGLTFDLHVFGSGFEVGSQVRIALHGQPTPKVRTNVTRFVTAHELVANITTAGDAPPGPYDVQVAGRNGKQGVGTELVDTRAHVFGLSPLSAAPGDSVTISGVNFGLDREAVIVAFDGVLAIVTSVSNTNIVAAVPPSLPPGQARVEVRISGAPVLPAVVLDVVPPASPILRITGISPSTARRGEQVTISGSGFGRDRDQLQVKVDGRVVWIESVEETTLVVSVPFATAAGSVSVEVSTSRTPAAPPAQTVLNVIHRQPLTGTWTLSGYCCDVPVGPLNFVGSFTLSEEADGNLQGTMSVTRDGQPFITGPIVGRVDGAVAFVFNVGACEFTGFAITATLLDGTMSGCGGATGGGWWDYGGAAPWEGIRQR
ncbi:MAG TPA: IPT/TIG domain-containing protein [Candidatus Polarisedimenticolia bacterium]|nr:IPT/TIG domain-containing protein [Candidatus Polarisedimenticolia bacterium]